MDSWAGHLSLPDYGQMAKPFTEKVIAIARARTDAPIIHYANGAAHLVQAFAELSADVIGVDHRSELKALFAKFPEKVFQGNLDPTPFCTARRNPPANRGNSRSGKGTLAHHESRARRFAGNASRRCPRLYRRGPRHLNLSSI